MVVGRVGGPESPCRIVATDPEGVKEGGRETGTDGEHPCGQTLGGITIDAMLDRAQRHQLAADRRSRIDTHFAQMVSDLSFQREAQDIAEESVVASWEALQMTEGEGGSGGPLIAKVRTRQDDV
jgi:hypothetical protein